MLQVKKARILAVYPMARLALVEGERELILVPPSLIHKLTPNRTYRMVLANSVQVNRTTILKAKKVFLLNKGYDLVFNLIKNQITLLYEGKTD